MGWVADYTSRINPATMPADLVGVCRYISRHTWKVLTADELRELWGAGKVVIPNFEDSANDWLQARPGWSAASLPDHAYRWLGGALTAATDAAFAADQVAALGFPRGTVIPGSADLDMTRTQWLAAGKAYATRWRDGLSAAGFGAGVYGPWDVLTWVHDEVGGYDLYWQAGMSTAWSGGRNAKAWTVANGAPATAHLRQRYHQTVGGVDTDHNEILRADWAGTPVADQGEIMDWKDPKTANLVGGRGPDTLIVDIWASILRLDSPYAAGTPTAMKSFMDGVEQAAAADAQRDSALAAALNAIAAGGVSVDTAAVIARINEVAGAESATVQALRQQIADLAAKLAAAGHALD